MTIYVILLVKVPTEHLGRLINSVFDFDGHTSSRLRLLYDLKRRLLAQKACETSGTYVLRLVVNFKRSAITNVSHSRYMLRQQHPHFPQVDDFLLLCNGVNLDDT